jgi:hypothetical protein
MQKKEDNDESVMECLTAQYSTVQYSALVHLEHGVYVRLVPAPNLG